MSTTNKPVEDVHVSCKVCLKEVPLSEAVVPEATDYFVHFCGVECFEKWKGKRAKPDDPVEPSDASSSDLP